MQALAGVVCWKMARIRPIELNEISAEVRNAYEEALAQHGRVTNMKRTLLHSLPAYEALMQWYELFGAVKEFIGERLAVIFSHAISADSDCLICTTFMRRLLMERGEDPSALKLDEKGEAVLAYAHALARQGNVVPESVFKKLQGFLNPEQIVALTAFGAMMVATNIINNALEVNLDEYLYDFRESSRNESATKEHS
jgi:alkylhydroperoxidase family enzyme